MTSLYSSSLSEIGLTVGKIVLAKNADLFPLILETPKALQLRLPQISKLYELRESFLAPLTFFLPHVLNETDRKLEHMEQYLLLNLRAREGQFPTGQNNNN